MDTGKHKLTGIIILNLKGDSPQRALRKVEINQGKKSFSLLYSARLPSTGSGPELVEGSSPKSVHSLSENNTTF
jgi:hypothetical protein